MSVWRAQESLQDNCGDTCNRSGCCGRTTLVSGVGEGNGRVIAENIPDLRPLV
ncbi:hypothetical protein PISMIDRAFT_685235 [Pisolithus microcarpus 441]|uniref:Uncharacterized protein n=1 Tax=Pisolithus microcarpus 441 TaxID=765257 RepID=A0A0C9Z4W1_9AGAM|nr:hypothetical protein PISMIDRAFT_685235 [Pisolithus microcarpus 441]